MTDEQIALSRRAVACRGWRWMPGMLDDDGCTVCSASDDGYLLLASSEDSIVGWWPVAERLPDLSDAATLGCLLALVRAAGGDPKITVVPRGASVWAVTHAGWLHKQAIACGTTEAEALVAALEAAP